MAKPYAGLSLRIAVIYAVTGYLWVFFSDRAVELFTSDPEIMVRISMVKGGAYVLLTAILLYWLIQRHVAEVRLSEEKLKSSEEKFSIAFKHSPVLMSISTIEDGRYLDVNDRFCQISGFSQQEAVGKTSVELGWISTAARERLVQVLRRDGKITEMELELAAKDGRIVNCLYSAEVVTIEGQQYLLSIGLDITEQKKNLEALDYVNDCFTQALHGSQHVLYRLNVKKGCYDYMSPAFEAITGHPVAEFKINGLEQLKEFFHPDDRPLVFAAVDNAVRNHPGNSVTLDLEYRLRKADGNYCWLHDSTTACFNANDELECFFGSAHDISERKKTEEAIKDLNEQLERMVQERTTALVRSNEELATFCYAVSHEIRAPIARLEGFCNILCEMGEESAETTFIAGRIVNASAQLQSVVDSILLLSRLSRMDLSLQHVDLSELVRKKVALLLAEYPQRQVELVAKPDITVVADPGLMEICINNLVDNAFKYTGQTPQARIEFGVYPEAGRDVYFVRDNGAGFDMTYAARLYTPFERIHQRLEFPGIGIGLATVKRIIERHGGEIWADSRIGDGAVFYFTVRGEK